MGKVKGPQGQTVNFKNFNTALGVTYDVLEKYNANFKVVKVKVPDDCTAWKVHGNTANKTTGVDIPLTNDDCRVLELLKEFRAATEVQLATINIKVGTALYQKLVEANLIVE